MTNRSSSGSRTSGSYGDPDRPGTGARPGPSHEGFARQLRRGPPGDPAKNGRPDVSEKPIVTRPGTAGIDGQERRVLARVIGVGCRWVNAVVGRQDQQIVVA